MRKILAIALLFILSALHLSDCIELTDLPVEKKVQYAVRIELRSRDLQIEKEPDDYGKWETYKVTVPVSDGKDQLVFHAIYAVRDDIFNTGQVETDYYDTILKYCYDSYEGEKDGIVLSERDYEGLHKVSLSCSYGSPEDIDAGIQEIKDFGIYADRLNGRGFRLDWTFMRNHRIACEDGVTRDWNEQIWSFDNTYKDLSPVQMAEFQDELEEKLRAFDRRRIYQLSPETEVYDGSGRLIELESLPWSRTGMWIRNEEGSFDTVYEDVWVVGSMLPIKHFYDFCNELEIPVSGDPSDYTVTVTDGGETHEYRFSYSFYDDHGFYYLKDGEKTHGGVYSFSLNNDLASEITGIPLIY